MYVDVEQAGGKRLQILQSDLFQHFAPGRLLYVVIIGFHVAPRLQPQPQLRVEDQQKPVGIVEDESRRGEVPRLQVISLQSLRPGPHEVPHSRDELGILRAGRAVSLEHRVQLAQSVHRCGVAKPPVVAYSRRTGSTVG